MEPEADAILGHTSAHSLPYILYIYIYIIPTGPVIADPFISPFRLTITPALSNIFINIFYLRNNKTFRLVF